MTKLKKAIIGAATVATIGGTAVYEEPGYLEYNTDTGEILLVESNPVNAFVKSTVTNKIVEKNYVYSVPELELQESQYPLVVQIVSELFKMFQSCTGGDTPPLPPPPGEEPPPEGPPTTDGEKGDWARIHVKAVESWQFTLGAGVKVGVCDTGVDLNHPDLRVTMAKSFVDNNPQDVFGHGTHVSGIIRAEVANRIGTYGVAPRISLYVAKCLSDGGSGTTDQIIAGVRWLVSQGVTIVNLSLGFDGYSDVMAAEFKRLTDQGIQIIAAAGNNGGETGMPAKLPYVVAVGATVPTGYLASFSSRTKLDICAPGNNVWSTVPGGYEYMSGTSMAAPVVTAIYALAKAAGTPVQGDYLPNAPLCGQKGLVNALKTVQK